MTAPTPSLPRTTAVIGSGIIGACIAAELVVRGHAVTLIDPADAGGEQAASFGNGAFISPASILPMSFPGMWRKVPGYLTDRSGPVTIRWRDLPGLTPWLWRFLLSGATEARWRRTASSLHALLADAPERHRSLAARIGRADLIRQNGLIYAFRDRAAFQGDALGWQIRRDHDVTMEELGAADLARLVPCLNPRYTFGILVTSGAHCTDPGGYVGTLAGWAAANGARHVPAAATGFDARDGRVTAVRTTLGPVPCDAAVIAAGIHSGPLVYLTGDRVPMTAERGYHVEVTNPAVAPAIPVMPQDGKMANTLTAGGLRAAGQVELGAADAPPDWRRADILLDHLLRCYPGLGPRAGLTVRRWQGNRPSTPDGLPVISPASGMAGVFHAFGHGHIGLAAGPKTGALIADLVEGTPPAIDMRPYAVSRFRTKAGR
ncbi:MAG: FAD-dependent oxidoreductase [Gemmobacter sp.]|nr:FAD-dependent oxidoreductase [Gemmobacter sp.]